MSFLREPNFRAQVERSPEDLVAALVSLFAEFSMNVFGNFHEPATTSFVEK